MKSSDSVAIEKCESLLIESRRYNIEHEILPSENEVIERLLKHKDSMRVVYTEIAKTLDDRQIDVFLGIVLSCAAFWNPEKSAEYRHGRQELINTNQQIFEKASALARLLEKREQLHNESGFASNTHYSIADVIHDAAKGNGYYHSFLEVRLKRLKCQFDLKYWPSLEEVVSVIATDSEYAETYATDELTEAATDSIRTSKADFLRAFYTALRENCGCTYQMLPAEFELTDKSVAEIMNSALDLPLEEQVDSTYVKRARQRFREKQVEIA